MPYLAQYEYLVYHGISYDQLRAGSYDLAEIYSNEHWNSASPAMDQKVLLCDGSGETSAYFKPAFTPARVWTLFDSDRCLCFYSAKAPSAAPSPMIFFRKISTLALKCELLSTEGGTYDVKFSYLLSGNDFHTLRDLPKEIGWLAVQYLVKEEKEMQCNTRFLVPELPNLTSRSKLFKMLTNDAATPASSQSALARKRPAASQPVRSRLARASAGSS